MSGTFDVIVTGDSILNSHVSSCEDADFLEVVELLRGATVAHTQLEQVICDPRDSDVFPAAEGAWSWFRAHRYIADELRWLGINLVSLASNHSLDYSYGGLRQTWGALETVGIPHAGTGDDLAAARAPAFLDTPHGRVALVSACATLPMFARAGAARADVRGRPGVNPLRHYFRVDRETAEQIIELSGKLGCWVTQIDDELAVNPAGLHNTLWRFAVSADGGVVPVPDEDDLSGNIAAIRHGVNQADFVIAHVHTHEWDPADGRLATTSPFVTAYAHAAIDAGAAVVIAQGSHAPMRGIEIYRGHPIFYDPGEPFPGGGRVEPQPADFYLRWGHGAEARHPDAGLPQALQARRRVLPLGDDPAAVIPFPRSPFSQDPGFVIPALSVRDDFSIDRITIHPCTWLEGDRSRLGLPALARGDRAERVLSHLDELSRPFGTELRFADGRAYIDIAAGARAQGETAV